MTGTTPSEAREVLRQAPWLRAYPPELGERLLAEGRLVRRAIGEWAQAEGDDRGGLVVVIAGQLHSYCAAPGDRTVMIGLVSPGAVLGHATRFSGGPRLVTAVCVEPTILLELTEAALDRVAAHRPELWRAIADFTYANMRSVLQLAAETVALGPRERLVARLLAAAERRAEPDTAEAPVIRISQELLGEMAGLTRKTANHHLSALARSGLIALGYGCIRLLDRAALQRIISG
ncbi:Crp/Fnr family transcriptional regulator [Novosphingobium flavum]|uniref:Crp/Fnr family transcriptional regulator n=1 Tax=Novosphingobium aerophilum TaxID=2839843 RepID=UPI00163A828F|nr:Crp/Fnr family transcriptional regulator [Novosphingobium aerophilum]MBC2662044.1 Crp/Fnr family transcriptional regulator [Novosphingobium aerophilum]